MREQLAQRLPEHMVPAAVVVLDRPLPLTPNGKVDRAALPAPVFGSADRAPANPAEALLCRLYADVLGVAAVGPDDDFFALGGDSIVSIHLVRRARGEGLAITPRSVFQMRTPARVAAAARPPTGPAADDGTGRAPVLPIVDWVLERCADPGVGLGPVAGYNQSVLLQVPARMRLPDLTAALDAVVARHDALRARLVRDGAWSLDIPRNVVRPAAEWTHRVDVAGLDPARLRAVLAAEAVAARSRLDPEGGGCVQAVLFDAGPTARGRLLLVVHHAVIDWVSWGVLVPDLRQAWDAISAGTVPELEPPVTSLRRWAELLHAAARGRAGEVSRWTSILRGGAPLPLRRPLDPRRDVYATAQHVTVTVPPDVVGPLLTRVPATTGAGVTDVFLTALGLGVTQWRRERGHPGGPVTVAVEGHGREEHLAPGADLSRTVGWFTSLYPLLVDVTDGAGAGPPATLQRVRDHLRSLPDRGIGFGMLRQLDPASRPALIAAGLPEIEFNYLGRFNRPHTADWAVAAEEDAIDIAVDPAMPITFALSIVARTEDRPEGPRLVADWTWPAAVLDRTDVEALATAWVQALEVLAR